ncbi:unnamed protein product [Soboliphyme baturini]|uniref:protein-tyrosine-phosphatase n=1 Tax=Soboliphyme baturini TaxID=241478 RepID=A0A183IM70_9BILA|nr:unnamed protein product [Soboliphyme baturini]
MQVRRSLPFPTNQEVVVIRPPLFLCRSEQLTVRWPSVAMQKWTSFGSSKISGGHVGNYSSDQRWVLPYFDDSRWLDRPPHESDLNDDNFTITLSRSFGATDRRNSRCITTKVPVLDTKQVHIYLRRQASCGSIQSNFSSSLFDEPNSTLDISSTAKCGSETVESSDGSKNFKQVNRRVVKPSVAWCRRGSAVGSSSSSSQTLAYKTVPKRVNLLDTEVCQVYDYLFMSGVQAAYNANFLCKFNIEYLIDVSNVEPQNVPRDMRSDVPCVCPRETAHSRARMAITIDEHSTLDLVPMFEDVNRFIDSARVCGKSVLIYSYLGRNRCAVFVVQYIMKTKRMNCDRAVQVLKDLWPNIDISENFYHSLRKWDITLNLFSASIDSPKVVAKRSPFITRSAWV